MSLSFSRRAFLALSASTALALAGCSAVSQDETSEGTSESTTEELAQASGIASTLTASFASSGGSPYPLDVQSPLFVAAGWHVFEGLYELDLHTYKTSLGLAQESPIQVGDSLEYKVSLRENAVFSDGSSVTSQDVVNAFTLNKESSTLKSLLSFIESVEATDNQTIHFKLSSPMTSLLESRLALVRIFPSSQSEEELKAKPVGSGPWCYESIDASDGGSLTFVANRTYAGLYPSTCEKMEWYISDKNETRVKRLTDKEAMAIELTPRTNTEAIEKAGATLTYTPGFNAPFLLFNCAKAPFSDARVRQAFYYALDIDGIISSVMSGQASTVTSFLPDYYRHYHRASTIFSFDQNKAKKLLSDAGVETISFTLRVADTWVRDLVEMLNKNWEEVGIKASIQELAAEDLYRDISTAPAEDQILPFDVVLGLSDPSCFGNDADLLLTWFYDSDLWMQTRSCWGKTDKHTELVELMVKARASEDEQTQQEYWNSCFDIVATEVPLYPLFHASSGTAYYPALLDDYEPISATGLDFLGVTPRLEVDPI